MTVATPTEGPTFAPDERPNEQANYFGFSAREKFYLPDGTSWIEFSKMNEGERKAFQDKTSRDVVLERGSGNARMNMLAGTERHELIRTSIKDWNLRNEEGLVPCTAANIALFLSVTDPSIIDELEKAIRKANPWLLGEMTVEDIDKEIANLQEMREIAERRERGESS